MTTTEDNNEFNNLKNFLEQYSEAIGAATSISGALITNEFVNKLLQTSQAYNWEQLKNASSLLGVGHQTNLMAASNFAKALAGTLRYGAPGAVLLKSVYDDWKNSGLPEETAKTVAVLGIGALIGVAAAPLTYGTGIAIISAGIIGLYKEDIWKSMVTGWENLFTAVFERFPSLVFSDKVNEMQDNYQTAEEAPSPLAIDLDGDGVETVGTSSNVFFDHDGNGFAENTGWIGKDDGILVRDINNNGQIDNGAELFGNNSVLSTGQKAANGFEALKDLDANNDGVFDNQDAAWNEVKVWKDANQNGVVDDGELITLAQAGVSGINLSYNQQSTTDANGNTHAQVGTVIKADGTTGTVTDVWFDADYANTIDKTEVTIPDDIKALPELEGFGNVHSLQAAMALDASGELKTLVQQFIAETDIAARDSILNNLIYHWAGVQDMDPNGRDPT